LISLPQSLPRINIIPRSSFLPTQRSQKHGEREGRWVGLRIRRDIDGRGLLNSKRRP
jgi:hypothetical protein